MAGSTGANAPPLGVVIKNDDGSNSIWNGKQWAPAVQDGSGNWRMDNAKLSAMGMGASAGPAGSQDEQKFVAGLRSQAASTSGLATSAADFMTRNARTKTGGLLAIPGVPTIMKAIQGPGSDIAAMDRDSVGMATSLRAPGQRLTQMEFLKNLGAGPSIKTDLSKNAPVAQQIYNGNILAQAQTSFYSSYLDHHRTLSGVEPAWLAWKNQNFGPDGSYTPSKGNARAAANGALKARSVQAKGPVVLDLNGNPVPQ